MGFFKRVSDIISANLNDLADQYEDPERMLRQAIREMEDSIAEVTQQTAKAMANTKTLTRELERNQKSAQQWEERAVRAVEADDDDLAKKAITRRQEHQKLAIALEDQVHAAGEASTSLRRQLDGMKAKLAEAKRNLATLSARKRAADFRKKMDVQACGAGTDIDENAFAKFERLKTKVEQAEAEAEAMAELRSRDPGSTTREDEDISETDLDADVELAKLKKKLKQ